MSSNISTTSSADISVKYHKLLAEYLKFRNQVSVLKDALLTEQSKNAELQKEAASKDARLKKLGAENESINFRNDQLLKRVESLQKSLDSATATFTLAKGKKKQKEANLRLTFGESSRQSLSQHELLNPAVVVEQELERKIVENVELHSQLFETEQQHRAVVQRLLQRIDELEQENVRVGSSIKGGSTHASILSPPSSISGSSITCNENGSSCSAGFTPQDQQSTDELLPSIVPSVDGNSNKQQSLGEPNNHSQCSNCEKLKEEMEKKADEHHCEKSRLEEKLKELEQENGTLAEMFAPRAIPNPIGVGITTPSTSQKIYRTVVSNSTRKFSSSSSADNRGKEADYEDQNNNNSSFSPPTVVPSFVIAEETYQEALDKLKISLRHAVSRANYYKEECELLTARSVEELKENADLCKKLTDLEQKCDLLSDSLESTRQNYELQMRGLYEHVAGQDAKIVEQAEFLERNRVEASSQKRGSIATNGSVVSSSSAQVSSSSNGAAESLAKKAPSKKTWFSYKS